NVFIEHIEAGETGKGSGSRLLNKLKQDFTDYTIEGIAVPEDRDNPHQELTEDEIEKYILFEAEAEYASDEEKRFMDEIRRRHKSHRSFDPFFRLRKFYRDNKF